MKIIGLMVVKDEDDTLGYCLDKALLWADHIIIMNNGSTDTTENIILNKMKENEKIIYWGRYDGVFRDGLRALMYLDYKKLFSENDWIIRLDADEIFIDSPRVFLSGLSEKVNFVKSASFQYYYTEKDHEQELENPNYLDEPFYQRIKYYACNWSEFRCAKIVADTEWSLGKSMGISESWPSTEIRYISSKRIHLKHYKYRSIGQIQKRVNNRLNVYNATKLFPHEGQNSNADRIYESKTLHLDQGCDSKLIFNYDKLPSLINPKSSVKEVIVEI